MQNADKKKSRDIDRENRSRDEAEQRNEDLEKRLAKLEKDVRLLMVRGASYR